MDYGTNVKPDSIRKLLQHQVAEQSKVCDVTLKSGRWTKRYHLHVLMESPFFQQAFRNNFQERHCGAVELHIGSPRTIDMAIMYLYGICPELNMNNIAQLLDLAEFFLLPNLKMLCFTWLQKVELLEVNVVDVLHLCSIYELNIPGVELFIEQRLLTLLKGDHLLTLCSESVANLFSDQRLSYVPHALKLKFISRWIRKRQNARMDQVAKCMTLIDIPRMIQEQRQPSNQQENCLLYSPSTGVLKLLAYSFIARKWYKLLVSAELKRTQFCKDKMSMDGCHLITYNDEENILIAHDLDKNKSKHIAVEYFKPFFKIISSKLVVKNGLCYLIQTERTKSYNSKSTLLMGHITPLCNELHLNSLLFFNGDVLKWCVNSSNLVAILTRASISTKPYHAATFFYNLLVYDSSSSTRFDVTHLIEDKLSDEVELYGIDQGFAVLNGCHISIVMPQHGPNAISGFVMMYIQREMDVLYSFIDNKCYKYSLRDLHHTLEETNVSDLLEHYAIPTKWQMIPMPEGLPFNSTYFKKLVHMSLQNTTLRCHFNCPHCELLDGEAKERTLTDKSLHLQTSTDSDTEDDDDFRDKSQDLQTCIDSSTCSDTDDDDDFLQQLISNN
ncbi:uncharacterized protein LOC127845339 [Dreissena polymorpha]|uniref:BTB domain-containing protein n=1 Tax=Dreissena polymorpha TaxID=45954 RepID=A0A9D4E8M9_DREPO|nr:uncharacterized protein LOC127845339 [Dreissena polymorpha]KAH3775193.1 hypothetical protein DPMN_176592 [Dreissena polymorpha]